MCGSNKDLTEASASGKITDHNLEVHSTKAYLTILVKVHTAFTLSYTLHVLSTFKRDGKIAPKLLNPIFYIV